MFRAGSGASPNPRRRRRRKGVRRGFRLGRRRAHRNPGVINRITSAIPAAIAATLAMMAGFAAASTSKQTGLMGVGATAAGSVGTAVVATASRLVKSDRVKTGLIVGAVAAPLLRLGIDLVKGKELPFGITFGLEDSRPFALSDYLVSRSGGDGLADYFRYVADPQVSRERLSMSGYGGSGRFAPFESV